MHLEEGLKLAMRPADSVALMHEADDEDSGASGKKSGAGTSVKVCS
jgi:hypothetical protein